MEEEHGKTGPMEHASDRLAAERDYYRQVAERLGRKALADAQDYGRIIRNLRRAEEALLLEREKLEQMVLARTGDLLRSNRELQVSQARYDRLVRRIPSGVYTLRVRQDGSLCFEYLSQRLCRILGVEEGAVLGDALVAFKAIHPEDREELTRLTLEDPDKHSIFSWEGRVLLGEEVRWIQIDTDPSRTADGDILWNGVVSDIIDRKRAEEKLRQSEELYRLLNDLAPMAVGVAALDGSLRMLNRRALDLFCQDNEDEEVIGRQVFEWVSPSSLREALEAFERIKVQGSVSNLVLTLRHGDGKEFFGEINATLLRDIRNQPQLIIIITADITDRLRQEEERIRLQKMEAIGLLA